MPFANETIINLAGGTKGLTYLRLAHQRNDPASCSAPATRSRPGGLAIDANLGPRLRVGFTANVINSEAQRGVNNNDNAGVSPYMTSCRFTPSFLDLSATGPMAPLPASTPSSAAPTTRCRPRLLATNEDVWRVIASANASLVLYATEAAS